MDKQAVNTRYTRHSRNIEDAQSLEQTPIYRWSSTFRVYIETILWNLTYMHYL